MHARAILVLLTALALALVFPVAAIADDEFGYPITENVEPPAVGTVEPPGGADGYDPALDADAACDAYVDLGIENGCLPPDVYTDPASGVTADTATLNGRIHPHGSEVSYYFEWGGGQTTPERMIEEGNNALVSVSETLSGLASETFYSYRLVARAEDGSSFYGAWGSLKTHPCEVCPMLSAPIVIAFSNTAAVQTVAAGETLADADTPSGYTGCNVDVLIWAVGSPIKIIDRLKEFNLGPLCAQAGSSADYYFAQERGGAILANKLEPECFMDQGRFSQTNPWPSNFHAAPVFQWDAWATEIREGRIPSWTGAAHEFRRRMGENGCVSGDRWYVNELKKATWLGSGWTEAQRKAMRQRIVNVLRGLYNGHPLFAESDIRAANIKGYPSDINWGQDATATSIANYRAALKRAYGEQPEKVNVVAAHNFWNAARLYIAGWVKQTYNRCQVICTGDPVATVHENGIKAYQYHQRWLALAAPAAHSQVKQTLSALYMPQLNGVWASSKYGTNDPKVNLVAMRRLIRQQVYSARVAASFHYGSRGRIAFAWKEDFRPAADPNNAQDPDDADKLAANLAAAIYNAYAPLAQPLAACHDNDAAAALHSGCKQPNRLDPGWDYEPEWATFKSW